MKRLWLAAALLLAVVGLCVATQAYMRRQTDTLLSALEALEASYSEGDFADTRRLAKKLAEDYTRRTRLMYCFVAHSDLEDSRETVALLPALLEREQEDALAEMARLREQLKHLREIDLPTPENVF